MSTPTWTSQRKRALKPAPALHGMAALGKRGKTVSSYFTPTSAAQSARLEAQREAARQQAALDEMVSATRSKKRERTTQNVTAAAAATTPAMTTSAVRFWEMKLATIEQVLREARQPVPERHLQMTVTGLLLLRTDQQTADAVEARLREDGLYREDTIVDVLDVFEPIKKNNKKQRVYAGTVTWKMRASLIWLSFYLHKPIAVIADMFAGSVSRQAAQAWLRNPPSMVAWLNTVKTFTFADVSKHLRHWTVKIAELGKLIPSSAQISTQKLDPYFRRVEEAGLAERVTISAESARENPQLASGARRAAIHKQSRRASIGGASIDVSGGNIVSLTDKSKRIDPEVDLGHWPQVSKKLNEIIKKRWDDGRPMTLGELRVELETAFPEGCTAGKSILVKSARKDFWQTMFSENKTAGMKWANWRRRHFEIWGWAALGQTISQKIPDDWFEQANDFVTEMRQRFKTFGVTLVLGADQTFVHTHPSI